MPNILKTALKDQLKEPITGTKRDKHAPKRNIKPLVGHFFTLKALSSEHRHCFAKSFPKPASQHVLARCKKAERSASLKYLR